MKRIQFYPKGEDPKGKNYIFFAAHPEDKPRYFNALWNEITAVERNCAFWFDAQADQPWDASLSEDLTQTGIQLFVFPVTYKLLTSRCNAIAALLPYAIEKKVPVLPILLEPGLEGLYGRIFGDLQYMDKVTEDPTAIPYAEKLKRFLQDTLVSKELAEKIRQAFDAYIFLSYRKKDRALAAKLMKLIHQIPQMRDVAIWYDEFLVPGEDFNRNITEAMSKSDLFTMAVTPNLVNEDNYVLSTEYPNALTAGKPIVAAQVADTDARLYHQKLTAAAHSAEKVPYTIDAYNADALEAALWGNLRHIALSQNNDPLHNYLIGLAYLNGIDVEMDWEQAMALITDAAEKGCLEAMERLAQIYMGGNGARPDFVSSMCWREKAVSYLRERCPQTNAPEDLVHLADQLQELACLHMNSFRWEAAMVLQLEALDIYNRCLQDAKLGKYAKEQFYYTLYSLRTTASCSGDTAIAYKAACRIIDELSDNFGECQNVKDLPFLAQAHISVANVLESNGAVDEAEDRFLQALDLLEPHPDYATSVPGKALLAEIYQEYGNFCMRQKNNSAAENCLLRAAKYLREVQEERITPDYMGLIVGVAQSLGELWLYAKEYDNSEKILNHALEAAKRFESGSGMAFFTRSNALSYYWLARVNGARGMVIEEEACYAASAELYRQLAQSNPTEAICREAATAYAVLGDCYQQHNKQAKAMCCYQLGKDILRRKK